MLASTPTAGRKPQAFHPKRQAADQPAGHPLLGHRRLRRGACVIGARRHPLKPDRAWAVARQSGHESAIDASVSRLGCRQAGHGQESDLRSAAAVPMDAAAFHVVGCKPGNESALFWCSPGALALCPQCEKLFRRKWICPTPASRVPGMGYVAACMTEA